MLRSPFSKIALVVIGLPAVIYCFVLIFFGHCGSEDKPDPEKLIPISFEFINSEDYRKLPGLILVTLIDPEKKVFLPDRSQDTVLKVRNGLLPMIFLPGDRQVSHDNPYRFKVEVKADGFLSGFQSVLIDSLLPVSRIVQLHPSAPPQSKRYAFSSLSTNFIGDSLTNTLVFNAKFTHDTFSNNISIVIPKGTRLLKVAGDSIYNQDTSAKLNMDLAFFSISQPESARLFPGGSLITDLVDQDGNPLATPDSPVFFKPVTWFTMDMAVGDNKVDRFGYSSPEKTATAVIRLDRNIVHPKTGEPLAPGDTLKLWKLIRADNPGPEFESEGDLVLQPVEGDEGTGAEVSMDEPATWALGVADENACTTTIVINVASPFEGNRVYECEMVNPIITCDPPSQNEPCAGIPFFSQQLTFPGNATHTLTFNYAPAETQMAFAVFKKVQNKNQIAATGSHIFDTCESPEDQTLIDDDAFTCMKIQVELIFNVDDGNGETTTEKKTICNNALWYKIAGLTPAGEEWDYQFAGFFEDGELLTQEIIPQPDPGGQAAPIRQVAIWFNINSDSYIEFNLPSELDLHNPTQQLLPAGNVTYEKSIDDSNGCITLIVRITEPQNPDAADILPSQVLDCPGQSLGNNGDGSEDG